MTLYMKTTTDDLELPIAVADNATELAKMLGCSRQSIWSSLCHKRRGWYKLEVEDDFKEEKG